MLMHLINLGLKTQRKHLLQAFIAGYRGFAGKAAAAAAAAGRKKAEKLPDWSKAVQLRNANLKPFTIRPEIEHLDIPVEEPKVILYLRFSSGSIGVRKFDQSTVVREC